VGEITRNLHVYALTRQQSIEVALEYKEKIPSAANDGTFTNLITFDYRKGFLTALTDKELQRLIEGGLTIIKGATLSLNEELDKAPDRVLYNKTDEYTYETAAKVVKYSIAEGITSLILDTEPLLHAN